MKVYKDEKVENHMTRQESVELLQDVDQIDVAKETERANETVTPRFADRRVRFL